MPGLQASAASDIPCTSFRPEPERVAGTLCSEDLGLEEDPFINDPEPNADDAGSKARGELEEDA